MKRLGIAASALLLAGAAWAAEPAASAEAVQPLEVGAALPAVTLQLADGSDFDLKSVADQGPAIVILYRGGW